MRELMNKAGEIGQDNLIAGVFPPAEFTGVKIAAGQGALRRGTVLAESDAGCVVLGTEDTVDENGRHFWSFSETKRLLEWAFQNFHRITLLDQDTENVMREVKVTLSDEADYVLAQPTGRIEATMPSDYDPKKAELDFDLPEEPIEAPVAAGQKLGTVTLRYDGVEYGTLDMVAADSVARSEFLYTVQQIELYWGKWWVKAAVIGGILLCLFALRER